MRVVSVPGRTVRHWGTKRVIDERGILYDPLCVTTAFYLGCGDLALAEDEPEPAPEPAPTTGKAAPAAQSAAE
ncbi:hypothetical protein [Novosphingobium sp. FSW06-99]|uniref:hypothetical protein n=1 Tax=Novosphingobium sp. FSW06-99 TaxID=1739113 RepID=UPI00076CFBEC|nr:hypothetical protein [Novosphingobium sp. FSW06-99]KUR80760.1 hypothetical protein AQZ49_01655 [Novosphingobium sp. FSW06-99]